MAKAQTAYVCQNCGAKSSKWFGKCQQCGEWNSLCEERIAPEPQDRRPLLEDNEPVVITEIEPPTESRIPTGIRELDRILGGGIVAGSAVLIGGDPGIGKSTLVLQASFQVSDKGYRALYVTAEESLMQAKLRADRLCTRSDRLYFVAETDVKRIVAHVGKVRPSLVIIDSIQMIYHPDIQSAPGTVSQVRECASELIYLAKREGIPIFLIGHMTKGGLIAGPRTLEHMVDTVLYFEGDKFQAFRILRAVKNRFGSTNEIGIFEMTQGGLQEVANPSALFLSEDGGGVAGSTVVPCIEGSRALLVEIQALCARANFGVPERKVTGVDRNRVSMLLAVLDKRAGLQFGTQDVFVNVVGGVRVDEPAADLGIAVAIASSTRDRCVPAQTVVVGEVGLAGEVRPVSQIETRLKEAQKLGFRRAFIPRANKKGLSKIADMEILPVPSLAEALDRLL